MNRKLATTLTRFATIAALFLTVTVAALADGPVIQVLFYNGPVTLKTDAGEQSIRIGQELSAEDQVLVAKGGSIQISINGKVVAFGARRTPQRVGDALAKVGDQSNAGVARSLETLASAAQMFQIQNDDESIPLLASLDGGTVMPVSENSDGVLTLPKTVRMARLRNAQPVILEPRATSVTRGPLRFSWLGAANVDTYLVRVLDRYNEEVFRYQTSDTTFVWEGANLFAESDYTWELSSIHDTLTPLKANFRRLNDLAGMAVEGGESQIRLELGNNNPALPVLLAAHFAGRGCYADAARYYLEGARRNPEHAPMLIALAVDQYRSSMGVSDSELGAIEAAMRGAE
jgi:hypothetical protein